MADVEGTVERAKGHVKEAAADITGDDELRREGKRDAAAGAAKQKVEKVKDTLEEGIDKVEDTFERRDRD